MVPSDYDPCCDPCRAQIEQLGFKPEKVAELVSRTFNEMIFIHGDVHCDPHAANLFLRKNEATGQLQLVLLDHGLYRQVTLLCNLTSFSAVVPWSQHRNQLCQCCLCAWHSCPSSSSKPCPQLASCRVAKSFVVQTVLFIVPSTYHTCSAVSCPASSLPTSTSSQLS